MSYPRDLDEYTEDELRKELTRRIEARSKGNCDYCGRPGDSTPCRFDARHEQAAVALRYLRLQPLGVFTGEFRGTTAIERYLADDAFCPLCGQGFRENFQILGVDLAYWAVECRNCTHRYKISKEKLQ